MLNLERMNLSALEPEIPIKFEKKRICSSFMNCKKIEVYRSVKMKDSDPKQDAYERNKNDDETDNSHYNNPDVEC